MFELLLKRTCLNWVLKRICLIRLLKRIFGTVIRSGFLFVLYGLYFEEEQEVSIIVKRIPIFSSFPVPLAEILSGTCGRFLVSECLCYHSPFLCASVLLSVADHTVDAKQLDTPSCPLSPATNLPPSLALPELPLLHCLTRQPFKVLQQPAHTSDTVSNHNLPDFPAVVCGCSLWLCSHPPCPVS